MSKLAAFLCMMAIVLSLAAGDAWLLTREASLSRLVAAKVKAIAGDALTWTELRASLAGVLTLEKPAAYPFGPKLKVLEAGRAEFRGRLGSGPDVILERMTLEDARIELSDELFETLSQTESKGSIRDAFPDPSRLPAVVLRNARVRASLSAIFDGGRPQELVIPYLSATPVGGYRYHLSGRFESAVYGLWTVRGEVDAETGARRIEISTRDRLRITPAFREPLVDDLKELYDKFLPGGLCELRIVLTQEKGQKEPDVAVTLLARDMSLRYRNFPLPLEHVEGEIEFSDRGFTAKRLKGERGGGRIIFDGVAGGYAVESEFDFRVDLEGIPLDATLRDALKPEERRVFDLFAPQGPLTARVKATRAYGGGERERIPVELRLKDVSMKYEGFPYAFKSVEGEISIDGSDVTVSRIVARDGDLAVEVSGTVKEITRDPSIDLRIDAERLPLDEKLREAIGEGPREIWDLFKPSGMADVRWRVKKLPFEEPVHAFVARLNGVRATYRELPLPVSDVEGEVEMRTDGKFVLRGLTGRTKGAAVRLSGTVTEPATLLSLNATRLPLDDEVKAALPSGLGDFLRAMQITGTASVDAELSFKKGGARQVDLVCRLSDGAIEAEPKFEGLDGTVTLTGYFEKDPQLMGFLNFTRARVLGKQLSEVGASFNIVGPRLSFSNLKATAYGGLLAGKSYAVDTKTKEFEAALITADRVDLQEFARDTKSFADKTLQGRISGEVRNLKGVLGDAATMTGTGRLVVRDAVLWDVPVFLKLLALNPGELFKERSRFDAGAVDFEIRNRKLAIERLALTSPNAGVVGRGRIGFDGELSLTLKGKSGPLLGIDFFILDWAGEILSFLASGVTVEVRGTFDKPEIK